MQTTFLKYNYIKMGKLNKSHFRLVNDFKLKVVFVAFVLKLAIKQNLLRTTLLFLTVSIICFICSSDSRFRGSHDYYAVPGSGLHACFLARGTTGRVTEAVGKVSPRVTTLFPPSCETPRNPSGISMKPTKN